MASATATARAEPARPAPRRRLAGSRLGRLIIILNIVSLVVLVGGALVLNELRQGLFQTRQQSLESQAHILAYYLGEVGGDDPYSQLDLPYTAIVLQKTFIPEGERARVFDSHGALFADSYKVSESVDSRPLPPARKRGTSGPKADPVRNSANLARAKVELDQEVQKALKTGEPVLAVRHSETGERVVSVSVPIQKVKAVLGVLTLEAADVDKIIAAQRAALVPYAIIALGVTLLTSFMIQFFVARPILRLSAAADQVRLSRARAISLPDLEARDDEIGDLARALETMTDSLSTRMDAIERFAADVAHEIKNPLTSIRSAVETLELVRDDAAKTRLIALLKQDVRRLDRLITDISNASRLDAELSRDVLRPIELDRLLAEVAALYNETSREGEPPVRLVSPQGGETLRILGREGPIAQVFRNLIDNARSFSPPGAEVRVHVERAPEPAREVLVRVDDSGPGMPAENLETVFERFYTSRPKGAAFGSNSGLGLSIARQIVEVHGGRIWAENRVDAQGAVAGARFTVALPEARS